MPPEQARTRLNAGFAGRQTVDYAQAQVQENTSTARLVCAVFTGDKRVESAVGQLVEAGFATESIHVLLCEEGDPEPSEIPVQLRTGIRRVLPIGAILGALGGSLLTVYGGDPSVPLAAQLATSVTTGAFLGAMTGIVLGLGHWSYFVDLPDAEGEERGMLVTVDLVAQGREATARQTLLQAGATSVDVCSSVGAFELARMAAGVSGVSD